MREKTTFSNNYNEINYSVNQDLNTLNMFSTLPRPPKSRNKENPPSLNITEPATTRFSNFHFENQENNKVSCRENGQRSDLNLLAGNSKFKSLEYYYNFSKTNENPVDYSTMSLPRKMPVKKLVSAFNNEIERIGNQMTQPKPIYSTLQRRMRQNKHLSRTNSTSESLGKRKSVTSSTINTANFSKACLNDVCTDYGLSPNTGNRG